MVEFAKSKRTSSAALEQDVAAGGAELRKMRTRSGDVVTVSLATSVTKGGLNVRMRFKMSGSTVSRSVATFATTSRDDALRMAWPLVRGDQFVEREGWAWIVPPSKKH